MTFTVGQRWISNTEAQLGLGIITDVQSRQISIHFPAAEEERIYAINNAPLSRIIYKEHEEIITNTQQKLQITAVNEYEGLILYSGIDETGAEHHITEVSLDFFIALHTPQKRLLSGLVDKLSSYKLKIETLHRMSQLQQSKVKGLIGSRTNHLPHQVYIADEVAKRHAPRVLLADEVGLGKTIEAGMIIHSQLHTGRASRVLLIVPDTLIHQWLVEMRRRFNLYFSIFDQNRYEPDLDNEEELPEEDFFENLFDTEQLVLCGLDFLLYNAKAAQDALGVEWDLVVVDEAHHLQWSEEYKSPEYQYIEQLSKQSKGLLLLTATPEQAGIESHFSRLRLLDPSRFYDFALFKQEEANYQEINQLVQQLLACQAQNNELSTELSTQLHHYLGKTESLSINEAIKNLLDRHGTGRVLFRNTRAAIQGFPDHRVSAYPLAKPDLYTNLSEPISLYPETQVPHRDWLLHDPRVEYLIKKLDELHPQKVLIICAKATTAIALEQHLKQKAIRISSFHEHLSIIERDRAAAYFAEEEHGAQALVCSEIGSEGRNFQFAHQLILFDLPLNPDLLEQRIGRLDRIGQQNSIRIHIPYLMGTAQEILFRWYHEGINLFTKSCSIGFSIYETFKHRLLPLLQQDTEKELDELIAETKTYTAQMNKILHEGRDRLLEMNSCNVDMAKELIAEIEAEENALELENYMTLVFHEYGVEQEFHSQFAEILRPGDHMKTGHFPYLKEDGMTVTYSRAKALIREDMEFLSFEHPMVTAAMEMILNGEHGSAALVSISVKSIKPGTLFLETFYTVHCAAPKYLQLDRFLPFIPLRILMDVSGKNLSSVLSYEQLNGLCEPIKRHLSYPIIQQIREDVETILANSEAIAQTHLIQIVDRAKSEMKLNISQEINRLEALQKINPAIRDDEITFFKQLIVESEHYMSHASLQLQAVRVVVNK